MMKMNMSKRFNYYLRMLSVMAFLVCSSTSGWACDYNNVHKCNEKKYNYEDYPNRNWVERLVKQDSTVLLRDLSIINAHDAGTWMSNSYNYKDQTYCERELFLKGVRAFDLRMDSHFGFDVDTLVLSLYLSHGTEEPFVEKYNHLSDEIITHFPTLEELGKEFIIIFFKYEDDDMYFLQKFAYYELLRLLNEKYQGNIVKFKPDLKVKDLQGKVLLMYNTNTEEISSTKMSLNFKECYSDAVKSDLLSKTARSDYSTPTYLEYDGSKKITRKMPFGDAYYDSLKNIPFTVSSSGFWFPFDDNVHSNYQQLKVKFDKNINSLTAEDSIFLKEMQAEYMCEKGSWSCDRETKNEEIRNNVRKWLQRDGKHDKYNFTSLNSYYFDGGEIAGEFFLCLVPFVAIPWIITHDYWQSGIDICADEDIQNIGVNHTAYDQLHNYDNPLGIISYDFCGTDRVDGKKTYGNALLNMCIQNNFKRLPYVSDIIVVQAQSEEQAYSYLAGNGYKIANRDNQPILNPDYSGHTGSKDHRYVYIGWKTTGTIAESVSDVILVKNNSTAPDSLEIGGKVYCKAKTRSLRDLTFDDDGWPGYLYEYNANVVYESFNSLWNSLWDDSNYDTTERDKWYLYYSKNNNETSRDGRILTSLTVSFDKDWQDHYQNCGSNDMSSSPSFGLLEKQWGNFVIPYVYDSGRIGYTLHEHTFADSLINANGHQKVCTICKYAKDPTPHDLVCCPGKYGEHEWSCSMCGYVDRTEACKCEYNNGIGTCDVCESTIIEFPAVDKDSTRLISSAGQLFVFSCLAAHDPVLNAKLTADVDFKDDMWLPIGSKEKPFQGTFDGQGHTISGINCKRDTYAGLFGSVNGGTVRNLGIINSRIIGKDYVGTFAGYSKDATFENIYSTANAELWSVYGDEFNYHKVGDIKYYFGGGLIGCLENTTVRNAYFNGWLSPNDPAKQPLGADMSQSNNIVENVYAPESFLCNGIRVEGENYGKVEKISNSILSTGKLALLLNGGAYGKDAIWRQNIDASTPDEDRYEGTYLVDTIPVLNRNHDMVVPAKYNGKDFINLHVRYDGDSIRYYRDMFNVSDQHNFSCPVDFAVMDANQTRDMKGYTWGTVCLPFDIDDTKNGNVRLFKIVAIDETDAESAGLYIEEIDKLPAGTPAICAKMDKEQNTISFICDDGCTIYSAKERQKFISVPEKTTYNQLKLWGTYSLDTLSYDNTKNIYAFRTDKDRFTKLEPADKIRSKPFRGWIETYNTSNTLHYNPNIRTAGIDVVEDDEVIDDVNIQLPMYDLSGRRVLTPFRGKIIIRKGKKILYNNK